LDLGCGPGGCAVSFVERIRFSFLWPRPKIKVILLDPSSVVYKAKQNVLKAASEKHDVYAPMGVEVDAVEAYAEDWIQSADLSNITVVEAGASLHHVFVKDVLEACAEKLPSGALFALGEWCHGLLKTPAHFQILVSILDAMIEPGILRNFDMKFRGWAKFQPEVEAEPPEEMAAILTMAGGFWPNHAKSCKAMGLVPLFSPYEGHVPKDLWTQRFKFHGFNFLHEQQVNPDNPVNTVMLFQKP
jgi:SAM-dependent methyltransferase